MTRSTGGSVKRSLAVAGHRTSVALEPPFWAALERIAAGEGVSLAGLIAAVDAGRAGANLASALRLHVLADLERRLAA